MVEVQIRICFSVRDTIRKWSEATKEPRPRARHNQSQLLLRHTRSFENSHAFGMEKGKNAVH